MEIWKDVEGYEGIIQVSNLGNVRRILKSGKTKLLKKYKTEKCGYVKVRFYSNGVEKRKSVDFLVAHAFIGDPHCTHYIEHIDGDISNNNLDNLEIWISGKTGCGIDDKKWDGII